MLSGDVVGQRNRRALVWQRPHKKGILMVVVIDSDLLGEDVGCRGNRSSRGASLSPRAIAGLAGCARGLHCVAWHGVHWRVWDRRVRKIKRPRDPDGIDAPLLGMHRARLRLGNEDRDGLTVARPLQRAVVMAA